MQVAVVVTSHHDLHEVAERYPSCLLEFRIDLDPELEHYISEYSSRVIVTLRSKAEGGEYDGDDRTSTLSRLLTYPSRYFDLELNTDIALLTDDRDYVLSRHDYSTEMTSAARRYLDEVKSLGLTEKKNIVFKFVGRSVDTLDALDGCSLIRGELSRTVVLSIQKNGDILRVKGDLLNQEFVFGSLSHDFLVHIDDLLQESPVLTGLVGASLSHSLSPLLHRLFRDETGMEGYYFLFELRDEDRFDELLSRLMGLMVAAVNITFPYKHNAYRFADLRSPEVEATGVCNSLTFDKLIKGENTDCYGFLQSLKQVAPRPGSALIYGSGDSAQTVAHVLLTEGWDVTIAYRSEPKRRFSPVKYVRMSSLPDTNGYDLFVNCTPLGLDGVSSPSIEVLDQTSVIDLVYRREGTPLVCGRKNSLDGKLMLFYQAVRAFELWTGVELAHEKLWTKFQELVS